MYFTVNVDDPVTTRILMPVTRGVVFVNWMICAPVRMPTGTARRTLDNGTTEVEHVAAFVGEPETQTDAIPKIVRAATERSVRMTARYDR